jgi:hypothetical protein
VWLVTGVVAGAASSLYAERKLKQTIEAASARLAPEALVTEVGRTARQAARSTGGRVREAMATGRHEMQRREEELWADLAASGTLATPDGTDADAVPGAVGGTAGTVPAPGPAAPVADHGGRGRRRRTRRSPSHLGK